MPSNFARIGIAALLATGSVGCHDASTTAASDTQAAPRMQPKPATVADCTPPEGPIQHPGYCSYPVDIRDFIDMRDACDHWRGEPVPEHEDDPDGVRKKQIIDAINQSCTGTDKRLAALKTRYVGDPEILQVLDEYEADIEADD